MSKFFNFINNLTCSNEKYKKPVLNGSTLFEKEKHKMGVQTVDNILSRLADNSNVCISSEKHILGTDRAKNLRDINNEEFNEVKAREVENMINWEYPERTLYIIVR